MATPIYGLKSHHKDSEPSQPPTRLFRFEVDGTGFADIGSVLIGGGGVDADGLALSATHGLLGFRLSGDYSQSGLISIDPANAQASVVGPWISRDIRGAVFDRDDRLWVIDAAGDALLRINPSTGEEVGGSAVGLTLGGSPFDLSNASDMAIQSDETFYVINVQDIYTLDESAGVLTLLGSDSGHGFAGATFSMFAQAEDHLFGYDVWGAEDIFRFDLDPALTRTTLLLDIIPSFNAGRGDMAGLIAGAPVDDLVRGSSGTDSCKDHPDDPTDPCEPDLTPGFPRFEINDPGDDIYEDYVTIESLSAAGIQMPIRATLSTLTGGIYADNPDGGGGSPPTGYWEYSPTSHQGTTSADDVLDLGEKITRRWRFADEGGSAFSFWVDVSSVGTKGDIHLGRFNFSAGSCGATAVAKGDETGFLHDDGEAEIYTGSTAGSLIVANRFPASEAVSLRAVSFHTSGWAAGDGAEVIMYEDPSGAAPGPNPSMEVWRTAIEIGAEGFQEVPAVGCPTLNPGGASGVAFFVAVANTDGRSYTLGIDQTGPYAGTSHLSTDGGLTFAPLSSVPIIDGNAMIRAHVQESGACFIGTAR